MCQWQRQLYMDCCNSLWTVMYLIYPSLHPVISTDASDYGLGTVFAQVQPDGTEQPVAFAFPTLNVTEQKYSTVETEALARVWATEKWRKYLWGCRSTLHTDHQAFTTPLSKKRKQSGWNVCCSPQACSVLITMSSTIQAPRTILLIGYHTFPSLCLLTSP